MFVLKDEVTILNSSKRAIAVENDIKQLVIMSQSGDRRAFDKLVRTYQEQAIKTAVRLLADMNEAAEAVQQGFVSAYLKIDSLKEPERFESWLLRIIVNKAINQRRKRKKRVGIPLSESLVDKKAIVAEANMERKELKEAIYQAMGRLSAKEAKAISLFGLENLGQKEAARIMGCTVEAVRWHVFKARKKLKKLLKDFLE